MRKSACALSLLRLFNMEMSQVVDNKTVVTPPCIAAVNIAAVGADFTLSGFSKISAADKIAHWRIIADSSVLEKWNILGADTEYKFLNTLQAPYWAAECLKWLRSGNVELRYTPLNRGKEFILHRQDSAISGAFQPSLLSAV